MDILSVIVAVATFLLGLYFPRKQAIVGSGANLLVLVHGMFQESHQDRWLTAEKYLYHDLRTAHPRQEPWSNLPDPARQHVLTIATFYDNLGKLVHYKAISRKFVIEAYGDGIVELWKILEPYARAERRDKNNQCWVFFEGLAAHVKALPLAKRYRGLPQFPPE